MMMMRVVLRSEGVGEAESLGSAHRREKEGPRRTKYAVEEAGGNDGRRMRVCRVRSKGGPIGETPAE
jgi:hypothetical protein